MILRICISITILVLWMYQVSVSWYFWQNLSVSVSCYILNVSYPTLGHWQTLSALLCRSSFRTWNASTDAVTVNLHALCNIFNSLYICWQYVDVCITVAALPVQCLTSFRSHAGRPLTLAFVDLSQWQWQGTNYVLQYARQSLLTLNHIPDTICSFNPLLHNVTKWQH